MKSRDTKVHLSEKNSSRISSPRKEAGHSSSHERFRFVLWRINSAVDTGTAGIRYRIGSPGTLAGLWAFQFRSSPSAFHTAARDSYCERERERALRACPLKFFRDGVSGRVGGGGAIMGFPFLEWYPGRKRNGARGRLTLSARDGKIIGRMHAPVRAHFGNISRWRPGEPYRYALAQFISPLVYLRLAPPYIKVPRVCPRSEILNC